MGTKNVNASESAEQKNINETGFFATHATTEAIDAVAKAIATICSATELEILGV